MSTKSEIENLEQSSSDSSSTFSARPNIDDLIKKEWLKKKEKKEEILLFCLAFYL
jgi:hypothetical protein